MPAYMLVKLGGVAPEVVRAMLRRSSPAASTPRSSLRNTLIYKLKL